MKKFIYVLIGTWMLVWYGAIRWTWFADQTQYPWAYAPINLATAFTSIVFLFTTMVLTDLKSKWLLVVACFLAFRNFYYTVEDIIDLHYNFPQQSFFILVDVLMLVYCLMFIFKTKK